MGVDNAQTFERFMSADQAFYDRLTVQLLRRGIFTLPGGRWYLSTVHDDGHVAETVQAFDESLAATLADGPSPVSS